MLALLVCCLVVGWLCPGRAYVNDTNWQIIQNNRVSLANFYPATFRRHPRRNGQKLNLTYPALYLRNQKLSFGQTDQTQNATHCASFNIDESIQNVCSNFRILKNTGPGRKDYYLIKPELFDPVLDDPVGFSDKFLVVVYDVHTDSSFFGTLYRPLNKQIERQIYAVDYDNVPVDIRGTSATSNGNFVLYVVRQRPFFQPLFHNLCRPIEEQLTQSLGSVDASVQSQQTMVADVAEMNAIEEPKDADSWFMG